MWKKFVNWGYPQEVLPRVMSKRDIFCGRDTERNAGIPFFKHIVHGPITLKKWPTDISISWQMKEKWIIHSGTLVSMYRHLYCNWSIHVYLIYKTSMWILSQNTYHNFNINSTFYSFSLELALMSKSCKLLPLLYVCNGGFADLFLLWNLPRCTDYFFCVIRLWTMCLDKLNVCISFR